MGALTYGEAVVFVNSIHYRPAWTIEAVADVYDTIAVRIEGTVLDVNEQWEPGTLDFTPRLVVPAYTNVMLRTVGLVNTINVYPPFEKELIIQQIDHAISRMEDHERHEWLRSEGHPVIPPHTKDGGFA